MTTVLSQVQSQGEPVPPSFTVQEVAPHDRDCFGCGQVDDHPRYQWSPAGQAEPDLYHYDCIPQGILKTDPIAQSYAAVARKGTHGDKLREHVAKAAASRQEDPADPLEEQAWFKSLQDQVVEHGSHPAVKAALKKAGA
jgi:hypothetical protein